MPQDLIKTGLLRDLRPSAVVFYLVVLFKAQHHSRTDLPMRNSDFTQLGGMSPNSVRAARAEAADHGLIRFKKGAGGVFTYCLCDPATGTSLSAPKNNSPERTPEQQHFGSASVRVKNDVNRQGQDFVAALSDDEVRKFFEHYLTIRRVKTPDGFFGICPFPFGDESVAARERE